MKITTSYKACYWTVGHHHATGMASDVGAPGLVVLGPLCVSADGLFLVDAVYVDADEDGAGEDWGDNEEKERWSGRRPR